MLSLLSTKIAGAVPTASFLQALESEVRALKNAEVCPYPVDRRCPHAGTGRSGDLSVQSEKDEVLFRGRLEGKFNSQSRNPAMGGGFRSSRVSEGNERNRSQKDEANQARDDWLRPLNSLLSG